MSGREPSGLRQSRQYRGRILLVHSEEMKTWDDLFAEYLKARRH